MYLVKEQIMLWAGNGTHMSDEGFGGWQCV